HFPDTSCYIALWFDILLSLCALLLTVSCYCGSRYYSDRNSFPTRRSSDLLRDARVRGNGLAGIQRRHEVRVTGPQQLDRFVVHQDRKSTRLNSSHGSISYAVFCLKKKKILQLMHSCPVLIDWAQVLAGEPL